jgi:hypothetical protein
LISTGLVDCSAMPRAMNRVLVTKMSSPTIWIFSPSAAVCALKPAQSFSSETIFDRDDRKSGNPALVEFGHLGAGLLPQTRLDEIVGAAGGERTGSRIEGDRHVPARLVTGSGDRLDDQLARLFVALQVRREAAFIADGGRIALLLENAGERMEGLGAVA